MSPTLIRRSLLIAALGLVPATGVRAQSVLLEIIGKPGATVGYRVAAIGDVDGDAVPDILTSDGSMDGYVSVYSGATGSLIRSHIGESGSWFGESLSGVGDVNSDGVPDYVVGAYGFPDLRYFGAAGVYSGKDGSLLHAFTGDSDEDNFGWSLSAAGDVDLDGVPDIIVGAPVENHVWHRTKPAYVRVFSGRTGSKLLEVQGAQSNHRYPETSDGLGVAVAGMGDLDGDGHPDFVAAGWAGGVHAYSGKDDRLMFSLLEMARWIQLGPSADIDGDGTNDIIASLAVR